MMAVHPSGYYAWSKTPDSERAQEDRRLLGLVKQSWLESGGVYGYRKIQADLRDLGECCGKHRVARLMRQEGLKIDHRGFVVPVLVAFELFVCFCLCCCSISGV